MIRKYELEMSALADDYVKSTYMLSEIYNDVPPELDCPVRVMEFHFFPKDKCKQVLEWLNRDRD